MSPAPGGDCRHEQAMGVGHLDRNGSCGQLCWVSGVRVKGSPRLISLTTMWSVCEVVHPTEWVSITGPVEVGVG